MGAHYNRTLFNIDSVGTGDDGRANRFGTRTMTDQFTFIGSVADVQEDDRALSRWLVVTIWIP